jgi:hypothetical protein
MEQALASASAELDKLLRANAALGVAVKALVATVDQFPNDAWIVHHVARALVDIECTTEGLFVPWSFVAERPSE